MGRTFQESLQKALRGLETGKVGLDPTGLDVTSDDDLAKLQARAEGAGSGAHVPHRRRIPRRHERGRRARTVVRRPVVPRPDRGDHRGREAGGRSRPVRARQEPHARAQAHGLLRRAPGAAHRHRRNRGAHAAPRLRRAPGVQARRLVRGGVRHHSRRTCTPRYEDECEADPSDRDKIIVLGGGPNRIGQGIEFDYCCVHAALALREDGYETIMVNCNPETVSTDYDTSDRLYFEPLTLEDVLEIADLEKPKGVIVQYGGQTPLKLARALEANGVPIVGTTPDSHRPGRGPRALPEAGAGPGPGAAAQPHRAQSGRSAAARLADRLSAGRAPELRARRPRDGNRARRRRPATLHPRRGEGLQRLAGAARPLPRQRGGSGRRRHRRQGRQRADRRRDGAHRGSRRAFGRLLVLAAAVFADARGAGKAAHAGRGAGQGAEGRAA